MYRVLIWIFTVFITTSLASAPAFARAMESGDADIAQEATPAVVNIAVWKMKPPDKPGDPPRRVRAYGSGFIIDPSGIIVTNKHVIDGAFHISATFSDGSRAIATLVAAAAMIDVAVLQVHVGHTLPALKWANSDALRVGDSVLTIGNPWGIGLSVSAGIVSALNRDLQDTPFDNYIQTDAAINHGNSGGPLIDRNGEVVGIDTSLYNQDPNGGFIGIGFAIPSNSARFVVTHLLDPNHPKPGWLGLSLQDVTPELAEALGLPGPKGTIISVVDPGGPAAHASLHPGDVVLKVGSEPLTDPRAFFRSVVMIPVGQQARLTIWRDGEEQSVTATVGEWPNYMPGGGVMPASMAKAMAERPPDPGVKLALITDAARKQYDLDPKLTGVLVTAVDSDCEARDRGVVPGDVVTLVQGEAVATPADVMRVIDAAHVQRRPYIAVLLQGKGGTRWISLSMGATGA
jgi:serine protease Do